MPDLTKIINLDNLTQFFNTLKTDFLDVLVPTSRKINNKALTSDITLSAADVNAVPTADLGVAGGVATLDANGKVDSSQWPASVDDPVQGESNKINLADLGYAEATSAEIAAIFS